MTQIGSIYANALYSLAKDAECEETIKNQILILGEAFAQEPDFVRLLDTPSLSKQERCQIVDDSFRMQLHPYLLNTLKLLTEKGYIRHFPSCVEAYRACYNRDMGILEVSAVTAIPLTVHQKEKLTRKLETITGKTVQLQNRVEAACMGGVRLDYDGRCVDDTISNRLDTIAALLKNTVL